MNRMEKNKNFEEQMAELEKIVTELEKGDLSLDESVAKFEEGIKLSKECNEVLEEAEKKITILVNQDGEVKEENFNTEGWKIITILRKGCRREVWTIL